MIRPQRRSPTSMNGRRDSASTSAVESSSPPNTGVVDSSSSSPRRRRKSRFAWWRRTISLKFQVAVGIGTLLVLFYGMSKTVLSQVQRRRNSTTTATAGPVSFQLVTEHAPPCRSLHQEDISYTLVTQCSEDRLWMMEYHCQRWQEPISLAVYTNRTVQNIQQQLHSLHCPPHVTIQTMPAWSMKDYPVNELRMLAFSHVQTTHVVYVDIDFWQATNLHATLQVPAVTRILAQSHQHAIVLPALALQRQCRELRECPEVNIPAMPQTKEQVLELLPNHTVTAFDPTNPGGHGSTHYEEWFEQADDTIIPIPCVDSNRYEPYLVVRYCRDMPPFQTAFSGYGKNKMTWMMQLRYAGYRFWQSPSFLIHYPHLDSMSRLEWNGGPQGRRVAKPSHNFLRYKRGRNDQTFVAFKQWLQTSYDSDGEGNMVTGLCDDHLDDDRNLWVERNEE